MAKTSMKIKQQRPAKYSTRQYNRCKICGRPHAYLRNYGICRIRLNRFDGFEKETVRTAKGLVQSSIGTEPRRLNRKHGNFEQGGKNNANHRSDCRYAD